MVYLSSSKQQTMEWGKALAPKLADGDVIILNGDLGAGKTVIVKGICSYFGIDPSTVTSPTFTLQKIYYTEPMINHLDLYRIHNIQEIEEAGIMDSIGTGITLIEWADVIKDYLPDNATVINIEGSGSDVRKIEIKR